MEGKPLLRRRVALKKNDFMFNSVWGIMKRANCPEVIEAHILTLYLRKVQSLKEIVAAATIFKLQNAFRALSFFPVGFT